MPTEKLPRVFLTAEWKYLIVANYEVDPDVLRPLVPKGCELDRFEDKAYLSVVGFMFLNTKVPGLKIPLHVNFEEVNLRFYVARQKGNERRRGVTFVREIVPKPAIAYVANALYNKRYIARRMGHKIEHDSEAVEVRYDRQYGGRAHSIAVSANNSPQLLEAEFILEHYWGYTAQRDGGTIEYHVEHPRRRVFPVREYTFDCDFAALYGSTFAPYLNSEPASVFPAEGSETLVRQGKRCA